MAVRFLPADRSDVLAVIPDTLEDVAKAESSGVYRKRPWLDIWDTIIGLAAAIGARGYHVEGLVCGCQREEARANVTVILLVILVLALLNDRS